jgi:hypothetical protein
MGGLLTIDRLHTSCHVWGAPDIAPAVVDRASRALRHHMPGTLKALFSPWLDRDDDSVWVVRRLDLTVAAAADVPPDVLASIFARSLGHALSDTLRGDGDGVNAIRFSSRTAYAARFVADAAAGVAWSRWYYKPFEGLKMLPASAAIRTALVEVPARGLDALTMLDDRALADVVAALTPEDETRLLDAWTDAPPAGGAIDAACGAAWTGFVRASNAGVARGRATFAVVRADRRSLAPGRIARAARLVTAALQAAETAYAARLARLTRVETDEKGLDDVLAAIAASVTIPSSLARTIAKHVVGRENRRDAVPTDTAWTRFGGLFLLLRDLDAMSWDAWTSGWPSPPSGDAAVVLRWLTAIACAGRTNAAAALEDAALRRSFGVPVHVTPAAIARWLRRVGPARRRSLDESLATDAELPVTLTRSERTWLMLPALAAPWSMTIARAARLVLRQFAQRLPGFAESGPEHLWRNFLSFDATIEYEDARVVIGCGRPPLHLVLTLTGMTRGLLSGYDADGRSIFLFPRE